IIAELMWTNRAIEDAIGTAPHHVRAPYGYTDSRVLAVIKALGMQTIKWNADTRDWASAEENLNSFRQWMAAPPSAAPITLQHDIQPSTASSLPQVFEILGGNARFVSVANCLGVNPYFDVNVRPPPPPPPPQTTQTPTTTIVPPPDVTTTPPIGGVVPGQTLPSIPDISIPEANNNNNNNQAGVGNLGMNSTNGTTFTTTTFSDAGARGIDWIARNLMFVLFLVSLVMVYL
ncbi:chitin deacetylase, partial [Chytridiales sp. JEL 0842]